MADDDMERLLREIQQATGGTPAPVPVPQSPTGGAVGRVGFAIAAGVGGGVLAWFVGLILPFVSATSAGIGGAIAAAITALVAGAPRWLGGR